MLAMILGILFLVDLRSSGGRSSVDSCRGIESSEISVDEHSGGFEDCSSIVESSLPLESSHMVELGEFDVEFLFHMVVQRRIMWLIYFYLEWVLDVFVLDREVWFHTCVEFLLVAWFQGKFGDH